MAWVGDHVFSYAQAILVGFAINCPESAATVLHDLREIGPTYFFAPPRIWESLLTTVMVRIEDCAWPKRKVVGFFLALAQDLERARLAGQRPSGWRRALYPLGRLLVYGPLRDNLGLRRVRRAYTAGEAIGPEIFVFFRGLGINVKQLYGMTEASVFVTIQRDGEVRLDSVGTPIEGVELKISPEGEVLYKSSGVFQGYFKNEEATRQVMLEGGWMRSGDAGFLDPAGHLKIIDRAKDVTRLAGGTIFAPKYVENKLKFSPYVKEAVCIGQDRPYVTALVNIDLTAVGNWAERRGIAYTSYTDLSQKPEIYELIQQEVERVNRSLLEDEVLKGAQIRKFLILHKELDPDDEEITRTRKVRRGYIGQKYAALIEALYGDRDRAQVEAKVTYEDGHTGTIRADVRIRAVGVARTFQNVALFKGMSVLDNLMTGRLLKMGGHFLLDAIWWGPARRQELANRAFVERVIDFLEIQSIRKTPAGKLPYGLQKRVELGRALAAEPKLLLLDEPMAGMNVEEKEDMSRFILDVNGEVGTTIALIEHDMGVGMDISDRVAVLDYGRKIADGPPEHVRKDAAVLDAYLGAGHD